MKHQTNLKKGIIVYVTFLFATLIFGFTACNNNAEKNTNTEDVATTTSTETTDFVDTSTQSMKSTLASVDSAFLKEATKSNYHEIALGKLAKDKTKNEDITVLANMMIDEHSKTQGEVSALAGKKSLMIDSALPDDQQDGYAKLTKETGKMFDKNYATAMVDGHKKVIAKFEAYVKVAKDDDIKTWATTTIPVLKIHLQHAQETLKKVSAI